MNLFSWWWSSTFILSFSLLAGTLQGTTLTIVNRCNYTVWPAIKGVSGDLPLNATGFELRGESSRSLQLPARWIGQIWGRTGCKLDHSSSWSCQTGDCGTGMVECDGSYGSKPITLAELWLDEFDGPAYYDVTLANGFNVPMNLGAVGGSGTCGSAGCNVDLNELCPAELALKGGGGCWHPCDVFRNDEYCCNPGYIRKSTCRPNVYREMFEAACPTSYVEDYEYVAIGFNCKGGDFIVTFCPASSFSSS